MVDTGSAFAHCLTLQSRKRGEGLLASEASLSGFWVQLWFPLFLII